MGESSNIPGEVIVPVIIKILRYIIVFAIFLSISIISKDTVSNDKVSNLDLWYKI